MADGQLELLVYGKDKEPLLHVPMTAASGQQEDPIEVSAEPQGNGALITLKVLGSYTTTFPVGFSE